jgi:transposase
MDKLTTVGIDLAKDVIAVCVLDRHGAVVERHVLRRAAFERWAEQLPPSNVAMEAVVPHITGGAGLRHAVIRPA